MEMSAHTPPSAGSNLPSGDGHCSQQPAGYNDGWYLSSICDLPSSTQVDDSRRFLFRFFYIYAVFSPIRRFCYKVIL